MIKEQLKQVVYTNPAKCRDCYRCVRVCPVNAIQIEDGQAKVIGEKCIACGTCVNECPQGAKQYKNDVEKVLSIFDNNEMAAVSIAPSFVTIYNEWEQKRLPSALRKLGFKFIEETAIGAYYVARESLKIIQNSPNRSHITSSCPAVVEYIEKYNPVNISKILEVHSPMMAHSKMLKKAHGKNMKVVFVGPCICKKQEAGRNENQEFIDAVLTFDELNQIFDLRKIKLQACEESSFDKSPGSNSRLFPLEGGLLKTADIETDMLSQNIIAVSGFDEIKEVLGTLNDSENQYIIEPLFCKSGCINGPAISKEKNVFERRNEIINHNKNNNAAKETAIPDIKTRFKAQTVPQLKKFDNNEILKVYERTGKSDPENRLNCGACGYKNCEENAKAVIEGMAEIEMCMPYMRRISEQKHETIVNASPNGTVIVDKNLNILNINPAFKKMFSCSEALIGKPISYIIDQDPFEKLIAKPDQIIKKMVHYNAYNIICHQIHYALPEEQSYVGIFVDITNVQQSQSKLNKIKQETIIQAQELMEHQVLMAQEMAKFLGENTAKGEILMNQLIEVIEKNK